MLRKFILGFEILCRMLDTPTTICAKLGIGSGKFRFSPELFIPYFLTGIAIPSHNFDHNRC